MSRIARVIAAGYPHHVTQRGNNRGAVFFDPEDRRVYSRLLRKYTVQYKVQVWAYCLMGNHIHLVLVPEDEGGLCGCMRGVNLCYTQYINRKYERSGRLWQNRFFSCPIEKERYLWTVARYVETNPVRAGLIRYAQEHAWSSAQAHVLGKEDSILSQPGWLTEEERKGYAEFLRETGEEESIRRATQTGRPFGTKEFVERLEGQLGREFQLKKAGRPKKEA